MAHFDLMFTNGMTWASRTFEAPNLHDAERIAVQLAREYMAHSEDAEDWSEWELRLAVATGDREADASAEPLLVSPFTALPS